VELILLGVRVDLQALIKLISRDARLFLPRTVLVTSRKSVNSALVLPQASQDQSTKLRLVNREKRKLIRCRLMMMKFAHRLRMPRKIRSRNLSNSDVNKNFSRSASLLIVKQPLLSLRLFLRARN
jgi:hypothetical protein